mgnify:CR=1 FL=1
MEGYVFNFVEVVCEFGGGGEEDSGGVVFEEPLIGVEGQLEQKVLEFDFCLFFELGGAGVTSLLVS